MSALRVLAARSSAALRLAAPPRRFMGAVSTGGVDMNLGRTPERTAELEKLAEEHNGFLFGELVCTSVALLCGRGVLACARRRTTLHPSAWMRPR